MSDQALRASMILLGVVVITVMLFWPVYLTDPVLRCLVRTTSFKPPKDGCLIIEDYWLVDEGSKGNVFYWECPQ